MRSSLTCLLTALRFAFVLWGSSLQTSAEVLARSRDMSEARVIQVCSFSLFRHIQHCLFSIASLTQTGSCSLVVDTMHAVHTMQGVCIMAHDAKRLLHYHDSWECKDISFLTSQQFQQDAHRIPVGIPSQYSGPFVKPNDNCIDWTRIVSSLWCHTVAFKAVLEKS